MLDRPKIEKPFTDLDRHLPEIVTIPPKEPNNPFENKRNDFKFLFENVTNGNTESNNLTKF